MIRNFDGHSPQIAESAWVHESAVVIGRVFLANGANIWPNTTLRGDDDEIHIGENSNIQDGTTVHLTGGVSQTRVGARVTVGHNCILHGCQIEDDVLIGMGSIIMDNARIGAGSFIGAGTLITPGKEIPPGSFVRGNPMQIIRPCGERERTWIDYSWRHYVDNANKHRASS